MTFNSNLGCLRIAGLRNIFKVPRKGGLKLVVVFLCIMERYLHFSHKTAPKKSYLRENHEN